MSKEKEDTIKENQALLKQLEDMKQGSYFYSVVVPWYILTS